MGPHKRERPYVIRWKPPGGAWLTLCRFECVSACEKAIVKHYALHRDAEYIGENPDGSPLDVSYVLKAIK